jgi:archaemetzincin
MILPVGKIDEDDLSVLPEILSKTFSNTNGIIAEEGLPIPEDAYDPVRKQYNSTKILMKISAKAKKTSVNRVLGVTTVDLYVHRLNFVFGEAQCPGKAAVISLCRLKPEFYGHPSNKSLFIDRMAKEAVHELGHTFGLVHCKNPRCVMFFSNTIQMTDTKECKFCSSCRGLLEQTELRVS